MRNGTSPMRANDNKIDVFFPGKPNDLDERRAGRCQHSTTGNAGIAQPAVAFFEGRLLL